MDNLYKVMLNMDVNSNDEELGDACGEILNIIAGQSKNLISKNYDKYIKLHPPQLLKDKLVKPVLIIDLQTEDLKEVIFGIYLEGK